MKLVAFHETRNFGDMLSKPILDKLLNKNLEVTNSVPFDPHYLGIGSIAGHSNKYSIVIGSGIGSVKQNLNEQATYVAVRGPYTACKVFKRKENIIQGDPAFLLSYFYPQFFLKSKEHKVSIVPHYVDYELAKELYPNHNIIDVINDDPFKVLQKICQSEYIISSSLHGLIAAQSYGIPCSWVRMSNNLFGDDIKFHDTFASLNSSIQKGRVFQKQVYQIQDNYIKTFHRGEY